MTQRVKLHTKTSNKINIYMYIQLYVYLIGFAKTCLQHYVTRLTLGLSPAKAQLVDEHSVFGGWLKVQISRLGKGCKKT